MDNGNQHINAVEYVAGRLSPAEQQEAEEHLVICTRCQAAVEAVQRVDADTFGQNTQVLIGFLADMLVGSIMLVAPMTRLLEKSSAPDEPEQEPAASRIFFEPLRVLQPRVITGAHRMWRFVGRFGIVLILTIIVLLLPQPEGLSPEGQRALAAFIFTGSILALWG